MVPPPADDFDDRAHPSKRPRHNYKQESPRASPAPGSVPDSPRFRDSKNASSRHSKRDRDRSRSPRDRDNKYDSRRRERSWSRDHEDTRHVKREHGDYGSNRGRDSHRARGRPRDSRGDDDRAPYSRHRSRSKSPRRPNGTANHAKTNGKAGTNEKSSAPQPMAIDPDESPEDSMFRVMGFKDFNTTKDTKVPGNNIYGVRKEKKTTYRQYMNRVGGFNRPLSPSRQ